MGPVVAAAAGAVVVPTVIAIVVPAAELRRQFVELRSEKVELAQDLSGQHWVGLRNVQNDFWKPTGDTAETAIQPVCCGNIQCSEYCC